MFQLLHILTVILVAIAMALSLAHVLELPGKLRLDRDTYLKVQTIYYPGFTIGGISEPLAALALLMLLFMTQTGTAAFWLMLMAFIALGLTHLIFWLMTQPVNKLWLASEKLSPGARAFSLQIQRAKEIPQSQIGQRYVTAGNFRMCCARYWRAWSTRPWLRDA
jgi:hypothetical protein